MSIEINVVQLNAFEFERYPDLLSYLTQRQQQGLLDILCMQEVNTGRLAKHNTRETLYSPLEDLAGKLNLRYVYGKRYSAVNTDGKITGDVGSAILSRHPIQSRQIHYTPHQGPYRKVDEKNLHLNLTPYDHKERLKLYEMLWELPWSVIDAIVNVQGNLIRVMTTHFPPSSKCTDIPDMVRQSRLIQNVLLNSSSYPLILAGDFNIERGAGSLNILTDEIGLGHVDTDNDRKNTLNPRIHFGFKNNIDPDGYQVDHIFTGGAVNVLDRGIDTTTDASDHFPVWARLEIKGNDSLY